MLSRERLNRTFGVTLKTAFEPQSFHQQFVLAKVFIDRFSHLVPPLGIYLGRLFFYAVCGIVIVTLVTPFIHRQVAG